MGKGRVFLFILVLAAFVMLCPRLAWAQYLKIVVNSESEKLKEVPLEGAYIICFSLDEPLINTFLLTDIRGIAKLPRKGRWKIRVEYLGLEPKLDTTDFKTQDTLHITLQGKPILLGDVVITGQYRITSQEHATYKVKVINQERIIQQGAINLSDILANELNIRLRQDMMLGTSLTIQGLSGQNIKILIDGVPLIGRLNGDIDLTQINLNNIEKIEIIEGPMSVIYGTDAMGGVINLITKKGIAQKIQLGANAYYESIGKYNFDFNLRWRQNEHFWQITGGRNFIQGFTPGTRKTTRAHLWKPREQYFTTIDYIFQKNKIKLRPFGNFFREILFNCGEPVITTRFARAKDEHFITHRVGAGLEISYQLHKNLSLHLLNNYNWFERERQTWIKNLVTLESAPSQNPGDNAIDAFNAFLFRGTLTSTSLEKKLNYQLGYDINLESARGLRIENTLQYIYDFAIFTSTEYEPIRDLILRPALRAAYNTQYGAPIVPSFNIKYSFAQNWQLRAAWAQGFRAPSLKELFFFFVDVNHNIRGNRQLEAEKGNNFNASLIYQSRFQNWNLQFEWAPFYNSITNLIQLAIVDPSTQLYQYVNIAKYTTYGSTLSTKMEWKNWNWELGFNHTARLNMLHDPNSNIPQFLDSYEFRFLPTWHQSFSKWQLFVSLFYKYNGPIPGFTIQNENNQEKIIQTQIQGYHLCDFSLSTQLFQNKLILTTGVKNLFNVTNIQAGFASGAHTAANSLMPVAQGTSYFISLKLSL
ncbi:MAG: TonB-dependent receptor [Bacteroidia bacterium]|nr:TonB-dependent receptor [Bacteroidia bacterium]